MASMKSIIYNMAFIYSWVLNPGSNSPNINNDFLYGNKFVLESTAYHLD